MRWLLCHISIHVPAWGTTVKSFKESAKLGFQSTFPRGERRCGRRSNCRIWSISIHVPAWGTTPHLSRLEQVQRFQSTFPRGERQQILTIFHLYIRISNPNLHFNITPFHIFYLIHFFWACFFQLFMVRIFWGFSVYFWFALYRNNT